MLFKNNSGGFVVAEFAIALPLLILLMYGLATVSLKIFELGRSQLADYVLESEAQYVMERITHIARAARQFKVESAGNQIKFVYHTVNDKEGIMEAINLTDEENGRHYLFLNNDILETQYFIRYAKEGRTAPNLYAKRNDDEYYSTPITGENYFGDTKVNSLKCDFDESKKILHISLEMESLVTEHKIKLNTAVFMSSYVAEGN